MNTRWLAVLCLALSASARAATYTDADAANHIGEDAVVTGKLVSVTKSAKGMVFLNLGDRFPRHTFGGVVFASDVAAVGDLSSFEGKDVALRGKIEVAPDKKPQIIIRRADQVTLAGAAPAPSPSPAPPAPEGSSSTPPVPAMVPPVSPSAPPASTEPVGPKIPRTVTFNQNWNAGSFGGDMVRKDLAKLFGTAGTASEALVMDGATDIYPGVKLLMPLAEAVKALRLDQATPASSRVATPGMPQNSLIAVTYQGVFPGGYDRIYILTDTDSKVLSLLFVEANARSRVPIETDQTGYHSYNFINGRYKALEDFMVKHVLVAEAALPGVVIVDTLFTDPTDEQPKSKTRSTRSKTTTSTIRQKTAKVLERSRWYVPKPVVNLILRCVGN